MKKLLTSILFALIVTAGISQTGFNRWMPATGTNTYTTNITSFPGSYNNTVAYVKFANTNTTPATIAINGLSAQPLRKWDGDSWEVLVASDIDVTTIYKLSYSGSYYEMESFGGAGALSGLTDVSLTSLAANDFLKYDGADWVNIAAASDHNILRRSGASTAFGSIDLSQSGAVGSSILPVANGGTGSATTPYWALAAGGALTGNNTITGTGFTLKGIWDGLSTTQTNGYGWWLTNTTSAALGAQQISPSIVLEGQGWGTTGSASGPLKFATYVLPVQSTAVGGRYVIAAATNANPYVVKLDLEDNGQVRFFGTGSTSNPLLGTQVSGARTYFGHVSNGISPISNSGSESITSIFGLQYQAVGGSLSGASVYHSFRTGSANNASGRLMTIGNGDSWTGSSGSSTWGNIDILTTYNSTVGTNIARGIYYNPTVTSATGITSHYSFQSTSGSMLLGTSSSDVVTSGSRLDIRGTGTTTNKGFRFANSSNTERLSITDAGTFVVTNASSTYSLSDNTFSNVATEGLNATVVLDADDGDDNPDTWTITSEASANDLTFTNHTTKYLNLTSDGRLYGTALHNNAGAVTGTTNQYVASGTYTPTLFNTTNIAGSTAYTCQWMRVGNVVTVSGKVSIDATAAAATELGFSLPIASAFTVEEDAGGNASSAVATTTPVAIRSDATNDRASFVFTAVSTSNDSYFFSFTYLIK